MDRVLSAILRQIDYFFTELGPERIETLYIGGGTPNSVPLPQLDDFIRRVLEKLPNRDISEFTLECNPEFVTPDFVAHTEKWGVTRLSMGIQSFNEKMLRVLERNVNLPRIEEALGYLEAFKGDYNLDLICGIPGQSFDDFKKDVRRMISRGPSHISMYTLTIEDGTPLFKQVRDKKIIPLPPEVQEKYWFWGIHELEKAGYVQYEISNFAFPGKESRHNMVYWEMRPFVGVGPGASGTFRGEKGIVRVNTPGDLDMYLEGREDSPWGMDIEVLDRKDFLIDFIAMGLRTRFGISVARFLSIFHVAFTDLFPKTINKYAKSGLMVITDELVVLSADGRALLNTILGDLFLEMDSFELNQEITWL